MWGSSPSRWCRGLHEARLADARLAGEQHDLALAILGSLPAVGQEVDLLLAADNRREGRDAVHGLEAALGPARPEHPPSAERPGETLQGVAAEVGILEQTADQAAGALRDYHSTRLGHRLQAGGEVGRLADHCLLLGRPHPD